MSFFSKFPVPVQRFFAPPPRYVAVAPDGRFFARIVVVAPGADAAAVASQMELVLEALAPFPLAQLYHGYFWTPGSTQALVYAAYRKRFLSGEIETWPEAELVIPAFVVPAVAPATGETVRILDDGESITGLYWNGASASPTGICLRPLGAEPSDEMRARVRAEVLAMFPAAAAVEEWTPAALDPEALAPAIIFKAGERVVTLPPEAAAALDVRDKDELAARRRAQTRDTILWRTLLGTAALIVFCGAAELVLVGARALVAHRQVAIAERVPEVDKVMKADALAGQIARIASQRLLPLEMLNIVREQRPGKTQLLSARMENLYVLQATARTTAVTDIDAFRSALSQLPACERVDIQDTQIRDGVASFTVVVRFKPSAVKTEEAGS